MKDTLKPGLKMSATLPVSPDLTVPRVNPALKSFADMPPVFTTAFMVAFAETTCIDCLADHLDDGEHSVGIHVDIAHSAATPVGMTVEATVELLKVDGRTLTFRVALADDDGPIGGGLHKRAVIDQAKFMDRVAAKAGRRSG